MDKKDIYEHLAKIYLDASLKRKNKTSRSPTFKSLFFISIAAILLLSLSLIVSVTKNKAISLAKLENNQPLNSELALLLQPNIVKLNFDFDPAKEENFSLDLTKLNLSRFKALGFSLRKARFEDTVVFKIVFTNALKEKSEILLTNIPAFKWQDFKIKLTDFKNITDWSQMSALSFVIEELSVREKKGIAYIDNVRLLK
jgi:hypothetical protein